MPSPVGGTCATTLDCTPGLTCKGGQCASGVICRDVADVCGSNSECCSHFCSAGGSCVVDPGPVANAGGDRGVPYHTNVVLDGSGSYDPDGDPITFAWALAPPAGSAAALSSTTSARPYFYADLPGVYTATLSVSDGKASSTATVHLTAQNYPPIANAGTGATVPRNVPHALDASASFDPNGDALTYQWALTSVPQGSGAAVANATAAHASFTPDATGTYVATVTVSDGSASSQASVQIVAVDTVPVADAGVAQTANVGTQVTLDGTASRDADLDPLSYAWTMTGRPAASSATLSAATSAHPTFTPDAEGTYTFSLTVSDGANTSPTATTSVIAYHRIAALSHDVIDAEYSKALDRIVMVSGTPSNALFLFDPAMGAETSVALSKAPLAVSVSPDGAYAAVAHDAMITLVDLAAAGRLKELTVALTVGDVALGPVTVAVSGGLKSVTGGFAYAFPAGGAQWTQITTVNLATGTTTLSSSSSIYGGTVAKLHPSGAALYGVTNGLSPANMENYQVGSKGIASYGWPSPYWGDYFIGGDLWIWQDGSHVLTSAGTVFNATPTSRYLGTSTTTYSDMVYAGSLAGGTLVRHASDSSVAKQLVVIPDVGWNTPQADTVMENFDETYLTLISGSTVNLPPWAGPGPGYVAHGRFAFWRSDASKRYGIIQGDAGTPAASKFGVVTY